MPAGNRRAGDGLECSTKILRDSYHLQNLITFNPKVMNEPQSKFSLSLCKLLKNLPLIEQDVRDLYDCEEMFEEIELYKSSLKFALGAGDLRKAYYEASSLECHYIDILTS